MAAFHVDKASLLSQTIRLASSVNLGQIVSRRVRGQLPTQPLKHKVSEFQSLAGFFSSALCLNDNYKLRSDSHFDKACKSDLSTFSQIRCGHRWTSQPLIALPGFRPVKCELSRIRDDRFGSLGFTIRARSRHDTTLARERLRESRLSLEPGLGTAWVPNPSKPLPSVNQGSAL